MFRVRCGLFVWMAMAVCQANAARADKIVLVAGGGTGGNGAKATEAELHNPFGVDFDKKGNMFIVELEGGHIHKVNEAGILTTLGGNGTKGDEGDGGPVKFAVFNGMHSLAISQKGDIYVADTWNFRVRRIDGRVGAITQFAGTGDKGYTGEGKYAQEAKCGGIYCVSFDPQFKRLLLTDLDNRRIRAVDMNTGKIHLVAGNGEKGVPKDGADAKTAPLVDPRAAAEDDDGNVWILERGGNALRVVDAKGKIRTVAGTGMAGATGDGGDALKATLNGPKHLCVDHDGSVIIADAENHLIRRYLPLEKKIVRVAGSGKKGNAGVGGSPLEVELNQPHGVYVHSDGTLYISDSSNNRILKIVKE